MRIRETQQYPETELLSVKVNGAYQEVLEGFTKVNGVWVPWDSNGGDVDLGQALSNKRLDGLTLSLPAK